MIDGQGQRELDIEALIRAHLDRESEKVDPRPLLARILAESPSGGPPPAGRPRRPLRWAGLAAAAAALIALVSYARPAPRAFARGEAVVREARRAHAVPIDRCYLVEVRRESSLAAELSPTIPQVRSTRLWTRGDRFWAESTRPDQRWAWGRDGEDRFWIAFGPHAAIQLEPAEVPDWLGLYCDLHSLNVEQLLGDVLGRFDLSRDDGPSADESSTIRVVARARSVAPRVPGVATVEMEIGAETRAIRRMVVRRTWNGQPFATVTYTLTETDDRDLSDYRVEGHLSDPSEVYTRDHEPQRRKELLTRWFGARPGRWPRPIEPKP